MPLPEGGPWPPPRLVPDPVRRKLAEWAAWYSGDPDQLSDFYRNRAGTAYDAVSAARLNRPSQYRGGVVGALARWWWGQPVPIGDTRTALHLDVAGDLAAVSSNLLFSEPPTLTIDHTATQQRLDELIDLTGLYATLLEAAEVCAALGGVYLRTCWDRDARPDGPWLDVVHPDAAVPEWRWGTLAAVTFWRVLHDDGRTVVRHLERHEPGWIIHGLYEGGPDDLGRPIPLDEFPETAPLAEVVNAEGAIETGVPTMTAGYVPNIRPARMWRHLPAAAPLGRSDYAGAEGLMDALDEVYSSLMRDIRVAKARLIVPSDYLQSLGPGQGAVFADREVYEAVDVLQDGTGLQISAHQFAIRVNEHLTAADHLIKRIIHVAGYSPQSFGDDGGGAAMTATEVRARERRSMITRDKKANYWRPAISGRIENLLAVDRVIFGTNIEPQRPRVAFGDSVSEDIGTLAATAKALRDAEAASTQVIVRLLHPDWDDQQVSEEVERVLAERGTPVEDPLAIRPAGADIPGDDTEDTGEPGDDTEDLDE